MLRYFSLIGLLVLALSITPTYNAAAQPAQRCFPETGFCIEGGIRNYWEANGGLAVFGYPIAKPKGFDLQLADGSTVTVLGQLFERESIELHPENQPPYDVLLGTLGEYVLLNKYNKWWKDDTLPKADPSAPHYFAETGHAVAPQFWSYWHGHGLDYNGDATYTLSENIGLFGYPITEPAMEVGTDGKRYLTQWFERARFELHPELAGTPYEVSLGLLGREKLEIDGN